MSAYVQENQFINRRTGTVLVAILGLHVFIIWAIATGLAHRAIEMVAPPIQADVVQEEQKKDEPPPPPPPQLERPPVEVPPPEVTIDLPPDAAPTAILAPTTTEHLPPPPPAPPHVPVKVSAGTGKGFPNSDDYYPEASRRLNEAGSANVRACIGATGKLTGDPTIDKSSGSSRLDNGALQLAKAGSGKYKPATEDGKPVESCFVFRVTFQLK
jgi:protein TonB